MLTSNWYQFEVHLIFWEGTPFHFFVSSSYCPPISREYKVPTMRWGNETVSRRSTSGYPFLAEQRRSRAIAFRANLQWTVFWIATTVTVGLFFCSAVMKAAKLGQHIHPIESKARCNFLQ
jgi:hypothetical protein